MVAPEYVLVQQIQFASSLYCGLCCVLAFVSVCGLVDSSSNTIQGCGRDSGILQAARFFVLYNQAADGSSALS